MTTVSDLAIHINDVNEKLISLHDQAIGTESRLQDIDAILQAVQTIRETKPVFEEYSKIHWESARAKYREKHGAEMDKAVKAKELLKKLHVSLPVNKKALSKEASELSEKIKSIHADLNSYRQQMNQLQNLRNCIRKVIPDALPLKAHDEKVSFREISEKLNNQKNLDRIMDRVTDHIISQDEHREIEKAAQPKERE